MSLIGVVSEGLAVLYAILPWYAGLVLLRGLLWLSPVKIFSLQRLLFRLTEPVVRWVREAFGLSMRRWDPSIPVAVAAILLFWSTAIRGGLNWLLSLQGSNY